MAETKKTTAKKTTTAKAKTTTAKTAKEPAPVQEQPAAQPINMVVEQKAEPVRILYLDSAIPNNQIPIGPNRYITGSGRIFPVPLEEFEGSFMTPLVMELIDKRKFIILSGLDDEQRRQYNCYYTEGEIVRSEGTFDALIGMPTDKAAEIYEALCPSHKEMVATRFVTAYFEKHDNRITRDKAETLNRISKSIDEEGLFATIVKDFNERNA